LGFDRVGIAPAVAPPGYQAFQDWLQKGHQAEMAYLKRQAPARAHPSAVLDGVRSIVVGAMIYGERSPDQPEPTRGKIARYARGADYHPVLWRGLEALLAWIRNENPEARGRAVADTAPLLERDYARLAGLGWIGKNTMLINRHIGSFTVLGALLLDLELSYDPPHSSNHCGSCTRCLDACPTDAFVGPYELDSRRCISYWTIEHRGPIPDPAAESLDGWAFGCDVCQDVCPWNRKAPSGHVPELSARPGFNEPDLIAWLDSDAREFSASLKGSALSRAKRSGLLRNAALILGSRNVETAGPVLLRRLQDDDPVVRGAAAWALGRIGGEAALAALLEGQNDPDPAVRDAVHRALIQIHATRSEREAVL
jgi:epoxyqueuosine reductase